ncbi:MAG: hypothetical protein K0U78_16280 [Actinomycetia bacterium]|nr:hypothetical protein [Actinomycetes bacterium]
MEVVVPDRVAQMRCPKCDRLVYVVAYKHPDGTSRHMLAEHTDDRELAAELIGSMRAPPTPRPEASSVDDICTVAEHATLRARCERLERALREIVRCVDNENGSEVYKPAAIQSRAIARAALAEETEP